MPPHRRWHRGHGRSRCDALKARQCGVGATPVATERCREIAFAPRGRSYRHLPRASMTVTALPLRCPQGKTMQCRSDPGRDPTLPPDCFRAQGRSYRHRPRASMTVTALPLRCPQGNTMSCRSDPGRDRTLPRDCFRAQGALLPTSAAGFDQCDGVAAPLLVATRPCREIAFAPRGAPTDIGRGLR